MTQATPTNEDSRESLIEEYSKYDDDLRLLAYRILLEKFNTKYKTLLPEQKLVLKEFVTSVSSTKKLKTFINERIKTVRESLETLKGKVSDEILRIKLTELLNHVAEIKTTEKVEDTHLVTLMNYYELIEELKHAE
jgi:phosphomevalonate kinase